MVLQRSSVYLPEDIVRVIDAFTVENNWLRFSMLKTPQEWVSGVLLRRTALMNGMLSWQRSAMPSGLVDLGMHPIWQNGIAKEVNLAKDPTVRKQALQLFTKLQLFMGDVGNRCGGGGGVGGKRGGGGGEGGRGG